MQCSYILINVAPPLSPTGYHSASVGSDYKWTFQPIMPEWPILGDMVPRSIYQGPVMVNIHIGLHSYSRLNDAVNVGFNTSRPYLNWIA